MRSSAFDLVEDIEKREPVIGEWRDLSDATRFAGSRKSPLVMVFVSGTEDKVDSSTGEADVERIRAEVRGLGVTLLILSSTTAWCFGPDDSLRKVAAPARLNASRLMDLFDRSESSSAEGRVDVGGLCAIFVIDVESDVRFGRGIRFGQDVEGISAPSSIAVLLRALVAASASFERGRSHRGPRPSFHELTTVAVIDGFERALATTGIRQRPLLHSHRAVAESRAEQS